MYVCGEEGWRFGRNVRVKGWPLSVVVEGVTREFFNSRSSPPVFEASDLTLSTTGPLLLQSSQHNCIALASSLFLRRGSYPWSQHRECLNPQSPWLVRCFFFFFLNFYTCHSSHFTRKSMKSKESKLEQTDLVSIILQAKSGGVGYCDFVPYYCPCRDSSHHQNQPWRENFRIEEERKGICKT